MAVDLCVLLWSVPGNEQQLVDYEDLVLDRLEVYGGELVQRVRRNKPGDAPYEVHVIAFPSDDAYAAYLADPERVSLAGMRAGAMSRSEIIPVEIVTAPGEPLPHLVGPSVTLRPGSAADVAGLRAVLLEPSVARWWNDPEPPDEIAAKLRGQSYAVLLVIEVEGELAGGIEFLEENDPEYRRASIDIFVAERWQGQGVGTEAVGLLASYLVEECGHHRLTIDPAAANAAAIAAYTTVGFRPVGVMRGYERGADGTYHDGLLMDLLAGELAPREVWQRRGTP